MPKRVIDSVGLHRSDKIAKLPAEMRPEYAWLLPLALAFGTFEASAQRVYADAYAYNRPEVDVAMVERILAAMEHAKLLYRWTDADGKTWGYWVGIEKAGRLPPRSRVEGGHEQKGIEPPMDAISEWLGKPVANHTANHRKANGCLGSGSGSGSGLGSGSGTDGHPAKYAEYEMPENVEERVEECFSTHPANAHLVKSQKSCPKIQQDAILQAFADDGWEAVMAGTRNVRDAFAARPESDQRYIPNPVDFYRENQYLKDPTTWRRDAAKSVSHAHQRQQRISDETDRAFAMFEGHVKGNARNLR